MKAMFQKEKLKDHKNKLVFWFWSLVNYISISLKFKRFNILGKENLPKDGPFLLISNHCSRWDGLIVYRSIAKPSNFMVSPNELKGLQGKVLISMGAFPANPKANLIEHSLAQFAKGESVVIFPEGNTFYDGSTHKFKNGAAKLALAAEKAGLNIPVIPCALKYNDDQNIASIIIGESISSKDYLDMENETDSIKNLTERMHREVCYLRYELGSQGDLHELFGKINKQRVIKPV